MALSRAFSYFLLGLSVLNGRREFQIVFQPNLAGVGSHKRPDCATGRHGYRACFPGLGYKLSHLGNFPINGVCRHRRSLRRRGVQKLLGDPSNQRDTCVWLRFISQQLM